MSGGRNIDVHVAFASRSVARAAGTTTRRASAEAECEERALLLLQGKELLLGAHRGVGRRVLEGVGRGGAGYERLGRSRLNGRRRRVVVVVVGSGRASRYGLPILKQRI